MHDEELIARFVEVLNSRQFESLDETEVPEELRTTNVPDEVGWYEWKIRPATANSWVDELEQRLLPYCGERMHCFPRLFRLLISRYRFARFEIGPIMFFANNGQDGFYELKRRILGDRVMSPILLQQGLLQFGNPWTTNYDPVCFDTRHMKKRDAPIVQIDHEDILSFYGQGKVVQEIAPSFREFVTRVIAGEFPKPCAAP